MNNPDHPPGTSPTDANSPWTMEPPHGDMYVVTLTYLVRSQDEGHAMDDVLEGEGKLIGIKAEES